MDNLPKFDTTTFNNLPKFDPLVSVKAQMEENKQNLLKATEGMDKKRREGEARSKQSVELQENSLKVQCEINETQKLILFLMQCVSKDSKEIIEKLGGLINSIDFGNKIEEGNLLLIQEELNHIKENTNNLQSDFISDAKKNLSDKGVDYTIMFILQGIKTLFLSPS